jgi:hypothetical protein
MQSNSGQSSEFHVSALLPKLRSALAKPGSFGPSIALVHVAADAACGARSAHSSARPMTHATWAPLNPIPLSRVIGAD